MKKFIILLIGIAFFLPSCAIHGGLTRNANNNTTKVVLSQKNYKVIERVQGISKATYVFGIGGLSKQALIAEAKADMLSKANIVGGSKAIINENVEVKLSWFPIVCLYEVIVSGDIIEFTDRTLITVNKQKESDNLPIVKTVEVPEIEPTNAEVQTEKEDIPTTATVNTESKIAENTNDEKQNVSTKATFNEENQVVQNTTNEMHKSVTKTTPKTKKSINN
ncbi:MAG: hypothetical protein PHU62_10460 [Bacteroidales bacterium]|nr:hypothetical protein [Bacteroidales bacterium]MDD4634970.1 hypothetical protein [Bacteroidales bacterium]